MDTGRNSDKATDKRPFFRRAVIVNDPVQIKYLFLLVVSMLLPFLFLVGSFNYLLYGISSTEQWLQPQASLDMFAIMMRINYVFLLGFPPIFILILFLGVVLSNRFAGPLKRIRREMESIAGSGDIKRRLYVRKNDDLKPVVDSINHLLDNLSKKFTDGRA